MHCAACRRAIHQKLDINMTDAREESELALNVSIQHVLDRTGLKPSQVCMHACDAANAEQLQVRHGLCWSASPGVY